MSQDKPVLWISVKDKLPERSDLIWLWYPGMERPEICLGRRARVLHDANEANALESDEWWMPAVVPPSPHNDHEPPQAVPSARTDTSTDGLDSVATELHGKSGPIASRNAESLAEGGIEVARPASGSPDTPPSEKR